MLFFKYLYKCVLPSTLLTKSTLKRLWKQSIPSTEKVSCTAHSGNPFSLPPWSCDVNETATLIPIFQFLQSTNSVLMQPHNASACIFVNWKFNSAPKPWKIRAAPIVQSILNHWSWTPPPPLSLSPFIRMSVAEVHIPPLTVSHVLVIWRYHLFNPDQYKY